MSLECPCCGDVGAEPDAEGYYEDGQRLVCGCAGWVTADSDGEVWINNGDGPCPKCDREAAPREGTEGQ